MAPTASGSPASLLFSSSQTFFGVCSPTITLTPRRVMIVLISFVVSLVTHGDKSDSGRSPNSISYQMLLKDLLIKNKTSPTATWVSISSSSSSFPTSSSSILSPLSYHHNNAAMYSDTNGVNSPFLDYNDFLPSSSSSHSSPAVAVNNQDGHTLLWRRGRLSHSQSQLPNETSSSNHIASILTHNNRVSSSSSSLGAKSFLWNYAHSKNYQRQSSLLTLSQPILDSEAETQQQSMKTMTTSTGSIIGFSRNASFPTATQQPLRRSKRSDSDYSDKRTGRRKGNLSGDGDRQSPPPAPTVSENKYAQLITSGNSHISNVAASELSPLSSSSASPSTTSFSSSSSWDKSKDKKNPTPYSSLFIYLNMDYSLFPPARAGSDGVLIDVSTMATQGVEKRIIKSIDLSDRSFVETKKKARRRRSTDHLWHSMRAMKASTSLPDEETYLHLHHLSESRQPASSNSGAQAAANGGVGGGGDNGTATALTSLVGRSRTLRGGSAIGVAPTFTCLSQSDGFYADPTYCTQYYICTFGRKSLQNCPVGTVYNPGKRRGI